MRKWVVVLLGGMGCVACTATEWVREYSGTEADLTQDRSDCEALSQQVVYNKTGHLGVWADDARVHECLEAKGWHWVDQR